MTKLRFDPLSDAFTQDPYAIYAEMRADPEPVFYEGEETWMLTRYADIRQVAMAPFMLRNRNEHLSEAEIAAQKRLMNMDNMPYHERFVQESMLDSEGDLHNRLRKLVFREFTGTFVDQQRAAIQAFVDQKVAEIADRDEIDFIADFAAHIPGFVIGHVLGVPEADRAHLAFLSEEVVRFYNPGRDGEGKARAEAATKEFYEYLLVQLADVDAHPRNDLLTRLQQEKKNGKLSEDELVSLCMLILMAGHGSTIDALGNGMHALLTHSDQMAKLRADTPALINTALQEMFRYEAPLPYFHRYTLEPVEVSGVAFPTGTRFGLLYGAANRDPAAFENAETFDITRAPNRHIAFGMGGHFCLGNHLARLDMDVIFSTLLARFSQIDLVEAPVYKSGLSVRGPKALRISLAAA